MLNKGSGLVRLLCERRVLDILYGTHLANNSMLKKTYSPLSIMFSSSAANIISRIAAGLAHMITTKTERKYVITKFVSALLIILNILFMA